jgi:hypothetical protein
MSHEHELSKYQRNGNRVDLDMLLDMGRKYQDETGWLPTNPTKNSGVPVKKEDRPASARSRAPREAQRERSPSSTHIHAAPVELQFKQRDESDSSEHGSSTG